MKTAIIFTGFIRSYSHFEEQLHFSLLNAFPHADLYFCMWDILDLSNPTKVDLNKIAPRCKSLKVLNWDFHKNVISKTVKQVRENDIYNTNRFAISQGLEASNRIRNQWYLVNQSKSLISTDYDVIVRSRFDLNYVNVKIPETIENGISIPYNFFSNYFASNSDIEAGFCDHMAYGDSKSMMKYLSMYEYIDEMYIKDNANISHAEGLLKYYLTKHCKIPITFNNNIQYQIAKNERDIDNTPLQKYDYENNIT
jgi:hypothetical protein